MNSVLIYFCKYKGALVTSDLDCYSEHFKVLNFLSIECLVFWLCFLIDEKSGFHKFKFVLTDKAICSTTLKFNWREVLAI